MLTSRPDLRIERAMGHLGRIISDLGWGALKPISPDNQYTPASMGSLVRWCQDELNEALADLQAAEKCKAGAAR